MGFGIENRFWGYSYYTNDIEMKLNEQIIFKVIIGANIKGLGFWVDIITHNHVPKTCL